MSSKNNENDEFEEVLQDIYKLSNKHEKFKIEFTILNEGAKKVDSRKTRSAFQAGALTVMALYSLYQDYLGKEGYIQLAQDSWIEPSITVPLSILMLWIVFATRKTW